VCVDGIDSSSLCIFLFTFVWLLVIAVHLV
jgi:hypothetical protein